MPHPTLALDGLADPQLPTARWASSLAYALAREEAAGRRTPRITEPNRATWNRFKGRLTATDFLALLFEDAAVTHTLPFDPRALEHPIRLKSIEPGKIETWLDAVATPDLQADDYITEQARHLGLPHRLARSDLHVVKAHQQVLELPGTGGQLAHYLVRQHEELTLKTNFTVACADWAERTLAGIVGLELAAPDSAFITSATPESLADPQHPLRKQTFDFVIGLAPDKGGAFHVEDQLAIWFSSAKVVLV